VPVAGVYVVAVYREAVPSPGDIPDDDGVGGVADVDDLDALGLITDVGVVTRQDYVLGVARRVAVTGERHLERVAGDLPGDGVPDSGRVGRVAVVQRAEVLDVLVVGRRHRHCERHGEHECGENDAIHAGRHCAPPDADSGLHSDSDNE